MHAKNITPRRAQGERPAADRLPIRLFPVLFVLALQPALAQTCAAPAPYPESEDLVEVGDTGMGETLPVICENTAATGPSYVYSLTVPAQTNYMINVSSEDPAFRPVVLLADGADACAQACLAMGWPGIPIEGLGVPAGTHWLVVTSDPTDPPWTQGAFRLQITGWVTDAIFRNGFD